MPKVHHVKKAMKDVPNTDIKKGESYFWWKFRFGGKRCSRTRPRQSQLTQSDYLSQLYGLVEQIEDLTVDGLDDVSSIVDDLNSLADECEEKRSNMPDQLQDSESGELLQRRADTCREAANALDSIEIPDDGDDARQEALEEVQAVDIEVE